ncbi:MAG TPA: hypothetical protein VMQ76_00295 [Terracidiphilus sp.]|jgi:hypothetical protein|nr:hypothetical protein [Terracidiphilus sp.]
MTIPEQYRTIPLTQGRVALVDAADYDWLMRWLWFAKWSECTRSFYAARNERGENGKQYTVRMHCQILGFERGDKRQGDHSNHNTLDNRRDNLRPANRVQSSQNRRVRIDNTSGHKGVHVVGDEYCSRIMVGKKRVHLGKFPRTPEGFRAASEMYDFAADLYFGEFALSEKSVEIRQVRCTRSGPRNHRIRANNKTGHRGVDIQRNKYRSTIQVNKKRIHLGCFPRTPDGLEAASEIYQFAMDLYFGDFAK